MSHFDSEFKGQRVLIVTNEKDPGIIAAKVVDVKIVCNTRQPLFEDDKGSQFISGGLVLPDTPLVREMLEAVRRNHPDHKDLFWVLSEIFLFHSDLNYAVSQHQ